MPSLPNAAIAAEFVWLAGLALYLVVRLPHRRRALKVPVLASRRSTLDWAVRCFAVVCFGVLPIAYIIAKVPHFAVYPFWTPSLLIGAAAFIAGLWFIHRSLNDLGRSFSPSLEIRQEHQLITAGIYQHIRHPMYLGYLMWAIAQAVLLPNWIAGPAALVAWLVLFSSRLRREEGMMLAEFGDEYRSYMARTARLVPGVF